MSIKKKLICLLAIIITISAICTMTVNAANAQQNFATGDNSTILVIAIAAIAVAALVIVILLLTGKKKNKNRFFTKGTAKHPQYPLFQKKGNVYEIQKTPLRNPCCDNIHCACTQRLQAR